MVQIILKKFGDVCEFSTDPNFDLYLLSIPYQFSDSIPGSNSLYSLLKRHSELLGTLYKEPTTIDLCDFISISMKALSKKSMFDSFILFSSLYLSLLLINMLTPQPFLLVLFFVIRQYLGMHMQFSLSGMRKVSHSMTVSVGEFCFFAFP